MLLYILLVSGEHLTKFSVLVALEGSYIDYSKTNGVKMLSQREFLSNGAS